jgi:hypothetical protein
VVIIHRRHGQCSIERRTFKVELLKNDEEMPVYGELIMQDGGKERRYVVYTLM